jgi:hypothetical protein
MANHELPVGRCTISHCTARNSFALVCRPFGVLQVMTFDGWVDHLMRDMLDDASNELTQVPIKYTEHHHWQTVRLIDQQKAPPPFPPSRLLSAEQNRS